MAADAFLKIDGIVGESSDSKHKGEIEVVAWSWGEAQTPGSPGGGGGGAGKVQMQDFRYTALTSKASPRLVLACASGEHLKQAVLTCRRPGKTQLDFLKLTFTDVRISSFHLGRVVGEQPFDEATIAYSRIEVEYRVQNPDGSLGAPVKAGWDLKTNKKV
jgi:type VI secretion system secreted protein Hcp